MRPFGAARLFALTLLALTAAAPLSTVLPGVGPDDPRIAVDLRVPPWSAMARLQVPGVSRCTAVLIGPRLAWTAAHCLWGVRLGHFVPPSSIHVLTGYESGTFAEHSVAVSYRIAPGFNPQAVDATRGLDVAEVTLADPIIAAGSALSPNLAPVPVDTKLMLGGYGQDRIERATADMNCGAAGPGLDRGAHPILLHTCTGTRGTSGGPVLAFDGAVWRLAGLQVGALNGRAGGVAVPSAVVRALLP